jgi:hypothetical protein
MAVGHSRRSGLLLTLRFGAGPEHGRLFVDISEKYLCNTTGVQLAHDWGVPALAGAFAMDCPKPYTWQLGRDSVCTALMVAQAGADLAEGPGISLKERAGS